jgi:hypothetical protein
VQSRPALRVARCLDAAYTTEVTSRHFVVLAILLAVGACSPTERTACDGFADRKLAISGAEYRGCAGEILAELDSVEPLLRAMVSGTANNDERAAARREYGKLRTRIRRTGIEADYWSRPGTEVLKWPGGPVSEFNFAAFQAAAQYGAVLDYPNADNFGQGVRAHQDARRCYRNIR